MSNRPAFVVALSGKRKCGKDHVADRLQSHLTAAGITTSITRLSAPLKCDYAKQHGVDYAELLTSGALKEEHRRAMVDYGEAVRTGDAHHFCRRAMEVAAQFSTASGARCGVIVADVRRRSDLEYFDRHCASNGAVLIKARLSAADAVRERRGWRRTPAVDDAETECDLDHYAHWDCVVVNDGDDACRSDCDLAETVKCPVINVDEFVPFVLKCIGDRS